MALLAAGCLLLLLRLPYSFFGSFCDLGASDVIFLVKASHLMSREDFGNVKELIKEFSNTIDIGRSNTTTHVGIVFFDNIGPPQTRIPLSAHGRISDLTTAIDGLARLPCGSGWCKEKESSFRPALDYTMSRFPKGRMKKIVVIHSGTDDPKLGENVADLTSKDPWLRVFRIFIKGNVVTSEDPNYSYLQAYHDPYKRYADRMSQLFPNVTVSIPPQPTPIPIPKKVEQGIITVSLSDELPKMSDDVCQQIFSCPPCEAVSGGRDPFDRETPIQSKLPENWNSNDNQATTKVFGGNTDDYEYEITADPPGMTINTNPAKNRREMSTTTPMSSMDYVYEESVDDEHGMRSKRSTSSLRQKDCFCAASAPLPNTPDTSFNLDSPAESGCTGSSTTGAECGATALPGASCGGSLEIPGSGCSAAAPQQITYTQPTYSQYPYPAYQPSYYQYIQQYSSPCRNGSPCARRYYSYSGYSPCGNKICTQTQQQYLPQQNYQQYYNYWYQTQQLQPQPTQIFQNPQETFVSQPNQPSYATPTSLPSFDSSAIHDGGSETEKKITVTKVTKEGSLGQLEKIGKPDDPFSAKAYGDSQFTKISSGSLLEGLFPVNLPPINTLLSKFDPPVEDFGASIPSRPVTLKPVDVGSQLTDVEDLNGGLKRVHRQ